ncbi:MAG: hypothetical protein L0K86_16700, partial [Actinomycetia bacterium]|nr:hypothetical protein [Actinomycetes bacterium]
MPAIDDLSRLAFAAHRMNGALDAMQAKQVDDDAASHRTAASSVIADCDRTLEQYRRALEAGADPVLVAGWTKEAQARKAEAATHLEESPSRRTFSRADIEALLDAVAGGQSPDLRTDRLVAHLRTCSTSRQTRIRELGARHGPVDGR